MSPHEGQFFIIETEGPVGALAGKLTVSFAKVYVTGNLVEVKCPDVSKMTTHLPPRFITLENGYGKLIR